MTLTLRYVLGRLSWTVIAAWLFLTVSFLVLSFSPDPNEAMRMFGAMGQGGEEAKEAAQAYRALRGRDKPLFVRYVDWLVAFATLQFGHSFAFDRAVDTVLAVRIPRTLAYLLPGIVVGSLLSVVAGTVATLRGGVLERATAAASYLALAFPAFVLAEFVVMYAGPDKLVTFEMLRYNPGFGLLAPTNLLSLVVPAALVAINIFAAQTIWVRQETAELARSEFVKTLRASGHPPMHVARRIVRNAVAPLTSLLVTEVVVVLVVTMYVVEVVLGFPGFGQASYVGFRDFDFALVLVSVVGIVVAALVMTTVQQLAAAALDPRIADRGGERE